MFLQHLLQRHPDAQRKIGCGISYFSASHNLMPGCYHTTKHFVLHRQDGSSTDFSYKKCLDSKQQQLLEATSSSSSSSTSTSSCGESRKQRGYSNSDAGSAAAAAVADDTGSAADSNIDTAHRQQQQQQHRVLPDDYYYKALRNAITPSVRAFKAAAFGDQPVICPLELRLTWSNSDVDHAAPHTFMAVVQGWLQQQGMYLSDVITPSGDNTTSSAMSCAVQLQSWVDYHEQHAVLRVLSRQAHWRVKGQSISSPGIADSSGEGSSNDSGSAAPAQLVDSSSSSDSSHDSGNAAPVELVYSSSSSSSSKSRCRRKPQSSSSDPGTADSSGEGSSKDSGNAAHAERLDSSSSSSISRHRRKPARAQHVQ
jgi:hypothetical protein